VRADADRRRAQSYHGGGLIGNHCSLLLEHAERVCSTLNTASLATADGFTVRLGDDEIARLVRTALDKFALCNHLMATPRSLCQHEQKWLRVRCASFGTWFPLRFPTHTVPPKLHALSHHVPVFAELYGSVGMFSEQPIESLHHVGNDAARRTVTQTRPNSKTPRALISMLRVLQTHTIPGEDHETQCACTLVRGNDRD
jgi:hypothetical protein